MLQIENTLLTMKGKDDDIDLVLALGNLNPCIPRTLKSERGAGVNAGSGVDMAFAASDPLSELVWSPHKGLCLKCADSSLCDKKPLLLWNVGPSNPIPCHPQSTIPQEGNDNENFVSKTPFHVNQVFVQETDRGRRLQSETAPAYGTSSRNCIDGNNSKKEVGKAEQVYERHAMQCVGHHINQEENKLQNNITRNADGSFDHNADRGDMTMPNSLPCGISDSNFGLALRQLLPGKLDGKISVSCSGRIEDVATGSRVLSVGIAKASEVQGSKHLQTFQVVEKEVTLTDEQDSENKMSKHGLIGGAPQELEFTAENNLPVVTTTKFGESEKGLPRANSIAFGASLASSRMDLYRRKGKQKAFSEGNVFETESNDEEGSHESVESSNSAGSSAVGRKRYNLEESIARSKRSKRETEDTLASTSILKNDSSFMNWISNMVKGYSRVDQDEDHSLALTIAHSDPRRGSDEPDSVPSNQKNDAGCKNMGFRTMFQSLYCRSMRDPELKESKVEHSRIESNELAHARKIPRTSFLSENDESCKNYFISKEGVHAPTSGNLVSLSSQLRITPVNAVPVRELHRADSGGNKDPIHSPKDGGNLSGTPEGNSLDLLSEGKAAYDKPEANYKLGSLWITRLSEKNSSNFLRLDYGNQNEHGGVDYTERSRFKDNQITFNIPNEQKTSGSGENSNKEAVDVLHKNASSFAENVEESASYKELHGHNYQRSVHKMKATLPSQEFKSSEAMASVFARRLDALKHISPSDVKTDTSTMRTCLFCGRLGHDIHHCSDKTESDMEALPLNANSYSTVEGSCLCLICFELDHWANSCPLRSLRRQQQLFQSGSSADDDGNRQHNEGNAKYASLMEKKGCENLKLDLIFMRPEVGSLMGKAKENPGKRVLRLDEVIKCTTSNPVQYTLKESRTSPLCSSIGEQTGVVPEGMFDAIRKLRLSRVEILKWMNSNVSSSYLDGFFLRLRLGKLEAGLRGTGYYVACITGGHHEKAAEDSKNPISVDVGGIQCLVGTQYVSNHDFLEEELAAWWCRTLKTGAKVPSKEDLESKFKERIRLGF